MVYHILNGDALTDRFIATGLQGELVVTRECLMEGDVQGDTLEEFYQTRARFIEARFQGSHQEYFDRVVSEFRKVTEATSPAEFNLWFGYDLFCQVNLWFLLSLLHDLPQKKTLYLVYPSHLKKADRWHDFGGATPQDLVYCFEHRTPVREPDLHLGKALWEAYKQQDLPQLETLSHQNSPCFKYLPEVVKAHLDRFPANGKPGRPEAVMREIMGMGAPDFSAVFKAFSEKEGVYGFGDSQVKPIYDQLVQS
ncbi:DUF1835 domain-containing protein [Rufibacter latericius]|uniref:DUF1835 domain-containing protein n=1 Tax=Rufibacter latericius TaxID=2487040 RepID=A0A3M9MY28_9BACT|nr:DUF1835 domain-containing protein [Rufibacter latericius]RNI30452.1 DUF1835 domain-containing protein [Rufibacter latericius]